MRGLAGALSFVTAKIVQPATGMGIDQSQRARLLLQGPHQGDEEAVFDDIGAIAGMEGMAIIHCGSKILTISL
ncbi:hypothetical protein GCM10017612_07970 [Novosphingobium resinovorum]|nr:hypothetical protein GCM10017612_07970 [Novosphingobium resinovorum]